MPAIIAIPLCSSGIYVKLGDCEQALEVFHRGTIIGLRLLAFLIQSGSSTLNEIASAVANLRHFILCAASFLQPHSPTLAADTFIQWKNVFSEIHSILIRLGLRANNRVLFQVLGDPLLRQNQEEQLKAFEVHQSCEKLFVRKYFPYILQALAVQTHRQILEALEPGDILLDYLFDVFHPDFDPEKEPRNNPLSYVTLLRKESPPQIFQLDLTSIHEKYGKQGGLSITYDELSTLCSSLGEHIFPAEVLRILEEENVNRLFISPDSYLHDLPLEAISPKRGGTCLFESFNVIRLSSPRELLREKVVASLRLVLNPSLAIGDPPPAVPDEDLYVELLQRSAGLNTALVPPETLIVEAYYMCGLQAQLPKSARLDSKSHDQAIPLLAESHPYSPPIHITPTPVYLKALQHSARKNIESLKSRSSSLEQQSKGRLHPQTKSLNADCYLFGNPQFDMDTETVEEEAGCIAALASMFWISNPETIKLKVEELPETQREIDTVQHLLSLCPSLQVKQPIVHSNATVESLLGLESPFLLHIATHGFVKSSIHTQAHSGYWSDTSTALLLAGAQTYLNKNYEKLSFHSGVGCLTPASVGAINLEATRLVFSSTCRSGIGTKPFHETSESMMQAFHASGAQTVISTLWEVEDSLTADFASFFYNQLMEKPLCRPSEALTLAKKLVKDKQESPSAWGAFVCSGIDHPLLPQSATIAQEIQMVSYTYM